MQPSALFTDTLGTTARGRHVSPGEKFLENIITEKPVKCLGQHRCHSFVFKDKCTWFQIIHFFNKSVAHLEYSFLIPFGMTLAHSLLYKRMLLNPSTLSTGYDPIMNVVIFQGFNGCESVTGNATSFSND